MLNLNLKFKDEKNIERRGNEVRSDYRSSSVNNGFAIERGDIWFAQLGETKGSIQGSLRPILVVSNNACNKYSPVITVVPITSKLHKKSLPVHVAMGTECGLNVESIALGEQVRPLNKSDLVSKIGRCTKEEMIKVEKAIQIQSGIEIKEDINKEVFDLSRVRELVSSIEELDEFINKWDNPQLKPIKRSRLTLIQELKKYCEDFGKDISIFYKDITIDSNHNYGGRRVMNA